MTSSAKESHAVRLVPSRYVYTCDSLLPGLHLAYSTRTGALLEFGEADWEIANRVLSEPTDPPISSEEATTPYAQVYARLAKNGFLVNAGTNEYLEVQQFRRAEQLSRRRWLALTIAPTMQCNFRCTYCFEEHRAEFMNEDTVRAVIGFIDRLLDDPRYDFQGIAVTWFGGEPLMSPKVIETIQTHINNRCLERKIGSSRSIITNGYLLDEKMVPRLMALGEWYLTQITVDGSPFVHNGRRPLVNGRGTYERVVRNACTAARAGMNVAVRMNIDSTNASLEQIRGALKALVDVGAGELIPRVYLSPVIDSTPECSHVSESLLTRERAVAARLRMGRELLRLGFRSGVSLPTPKCEVCTADNETGFCISPKGYLFKCWNEIHMDRTHAIGSIVDDLWVDPSDSARNLATWGAYDPFAKTDCRDCVALPVCMGGCPWDARLEDETHGACGEFKVAPQRVVQLAHADRAIDKMRCGDACKCE